MQSTTSQQSGFSTKSQQILQDVASKSLAKIYAIEGIFNDEQLRVVWNAFGLYISKNMRSGRGVNIPRFGLFTFTPPQLSLKGVTNPEERDSKPRNPLFVVAKDFVWGKTLKPACYYHQDFGSGLRAYTVYGQNGDVPTTKLNLTQVASYANMSKDSTETALNRILKHLSEKTLTNGSCRMDIPSVGIFIVRNNLVGVKFNQFILRDTRTILSKSLDQRKKKGQMGLTSDNLKKFAQLSDSQVKLNDKTIEFLEIDNKTKQYLTTAFGFHFNNDANLKRNITNFDRTVATKQFEDFSNLRESHYNKFKQSRFTNQSFMSHRSNPLKYDYNMALKLIKEWSYKQSLNSHNSYIEFSKLAKDNGSIKSILTQSDVWNGCKKITLDITQQQAHQLFRILDINHDGVVSYEDWIKVVKFDFDNSHKKVVQFIKQNGYSREKIINLLDIKSITNIDSFTLQNSLLKLCKFLTESEAQHVSKVIMKNRNTIATQELLQNLQISEINLTKTDKQWESKFLQRVKLAMLSHDILQEQLENKFAFYDSNKNGFINQNQFKSVLNTAGINLTLSQLVKLVQNIPLNQKNQINYIEFLNRLSSIQLQENHMTQEPINYSKFLQTIEFNVIKKNPFPYILPISVQALTSELQSKYFPDYSDQSLKSHVKAIDIDGDGQISKNDIDAFILKQYTKKLSDSVISVSNDILIDIIKQIRERLLKKRINAEKLFKLLDTNRDGFVTVTEWNAIDHIIKLESHVKLALFKFIDKKGLSMFDLKTFEEVLQDRTSKYSEEGYDWVDQCIERLKNWHKKSGLLPEDAFKVIDKDFDTYITESDLNQFLQDTLKYQQRELTHVRMQKLFKIFDTFKRGKIDVVDFMKILKLEQSNWISNAKQQIGLGISRKYENISLAFKTITKGQSKLVYTDFFNWINSLKMTSGFMLNQNMIKYLFTNLDSHKKGYLQQSDFRLAFGEYNWSTNITLEFIQTLKIKFKSLSHYYKYFVGSVNIPLTYDKFERSIKEVFGTRFSNEDNKQLWKHISAGKNEIDFQNFQIALDYHLNNPKDPLENDYPRDKWIYQDYNIIKGTVSRSMQYDFKDRDDIETQCRRIVQIVKDILRTSPKTLQQAFTEADRDKRGVVTNLEFKHAFRILKIALTSKQIDLLLNFCDYRLQNLIDWRDFIKKFKLMSDKRKIQARTHPKIQQFSNLLHYYMISPKDSYRKYNNPSTGYMSFEEFYNMVKQLYRLHKTDPLPEYGIVKQIFDFIDVRKDGKLDYQEWVQTFRNYNPPSVIQGTRIAPKEHESEQSELPVRLQALPNFQQSLYFEQLTKLIGRNRKYIQQRIQKMKPNGPLVEYAVIQRLIQELVQQQKMNFPNQVYKNLVAFALVKDKVDYRLLLNTFKVRLEAVTQFPKHKVF